MSQFSHRTPPWGPLNIASLFLHIFKNSLFSSLTSTDCYEVHFHPCLIINQGFKRGSEWRTSSLKCSSNIFKHQPRYEISQARPYGRFIDIKINFRRKKLHMTNQGSNFLVGIFSNRFNVRASIQIRRKRQSQHVQNFSLRTNPSSFTLKAAEFS